MKIFTLLFLSIFLLQDRGLQKYEALRKEYYKFIKSSEEKKKRENWVRLAEDFKKIQDIYPDSKKADSSLYTAGRLYMEIYQRFGKKEDLSLAILQFEKLYNFYPNSRFADDALFAIAENARAREKNIKKALRYYNLILKKYPQGDQRERALHWIKFLKRTFSEKEANRFDPGNIEYFSYDNYFRAVINSYKPLHYFYNRLESFTEGGERIYVDMKSSVLRGGGRRIEVNSGVLSSIRVAQHDSETVRVVFDIKCSLEDYQVFHLEEPFKIVVDVFCKSERFAGDEITYLLEGDEDKEERQKENAERIPVIVIDPGHGGKDPGAIGKRGTREKDITLKLAREISKKLKEKNVKVFLTRDKDVYLSLEERTAIANSLNADIFVSIHANSTRDKKTKGIETYYFSKTSDRDVLKLAAAENNLKSITNLSDVQFILYDMQAEYKSQLSKVLGEYIQNSATDKFQFQRVTKDLGAKPGPFFVLKNALMASALVEVGFISHPEEERYLLDDAYIDALASSIAEGILKFLKEQEKFSI